MTDNLLSITIRPTEQEFEGIKTPMDVFIEYMKPNEYIVSLEKGQKKGHFNHYQVAYISGRHIDTIRRAINRIFKPHLSPSTLKKGVWKKCIKHNDSVSLIGYCQKEGNIYSTNIDASKLKAELNLYNSVKEATAHKKANLLPCMHRKEQRKLLFLYCPCAVCSQCAISSKPCRMYPEGRPKRKCKLCPK